ncbi:MAG: hypothetical protein OEY94_07405 [Alphaproteobacteria bacterium]|nr:hypothetical protein [Alphaproteobacteria bacterium]
MDIKTALKDSSRNFSSGASKGVGIFADIAGTVSCGSFIFSLCGLLGKATGFTPNVPVSETSVAALGSLLFMLGFDYVKDEFNNLSKKLETEPDDLGVSMVLGRVTGFSAATALTIAIASAASQAIIDKIDLAEPDQSQHIEKIIPNME